MIDCSRKQPEDPERQAEVARRVPQVAGGSCRSLRVLESHLGAGRQDTFRTAAVYGQASRR